MSSLPVDHIARNPATDAGATDWLAPALDRHALAVVLGIAVAAAAWWATGGPGTGLTLGLVVAMVAILGLPHGAFDMEVGRRLYRARHGRIWWPRFVAAYLAAAAVVVLWWWVHPATALISLLVLGIAHFGDEDLGPESDGVAGARRLFRAISRGVVPVLAPLAFRPEAVAAIFGQLLAAGYGSGAAMGGLADAGIVRAIGVGGFALGLPGLIDAAFAGTRGRGRLPLVEPAVICLAAAVMPPLMFFAAYFCLVHAVRHSLRSAAEMTPGGIGPALRGFVRVTWLPTAATILGAAAIAIWLVNGLELGADHAAVRVVFIGLHALTVPHVLLSLAERRASRHGVTP